MAHKKHIGSILVATTSFLGGLAAGFLLAPDSGPKNRAWLNEQASELSDWMDRQRKFASHQTDRRIKKLRKNMGRGVKQNFPNLYEATEHIALSDRDIIGE